jgi:muramoyltetrapeptide carboxypeptidase
VNKKIAAPGREGLLVPGPLKPGDLVGIVAPSGPADTGLLNVGIEFLQRQGFNILAGCNVNAQCGYLAGPDDQRCWDLNAMLREPRIRGVCFARGGYGVMRILDSVDIEAVRADPKILLGMSDITALQLSLFTRTGLVTFAGPMPAGQMAAGLDSVSAESLVTAMTRPIEQRDLFISSPGVHVLRSGKASGALIGGCLSLVCALLGTAHSPDYTDAILLLEDVNEPAYRIDRMLTQLKLAGILARIRGMVLGHFIGPDENGNLGSTVEKIVLELTEDNPIPVVSRFLHGHTLPNLTVPHGAPADLNTDAPSLLVWPSG